ncbi:MULTISPECIES: hypothetical protein [unclassified Leeuwenhoekiella]|uniref:hypothetical protein n=2 Tax=unclassified Leeuwenhoekiella TaxID=2615029 RepID=UPI0025C38E1D|nr:MULTISPECIES: hypothetical protein [unclassified Leeuwenhoekiella]
MKNNLGCNAMQSCEKAIRSLKNKMPSITKFRKRLILFTLLQPIYFITTLYFDLSTPVLDFSFVIIMLSFYAYYIYFIWSIEAMKKTDKIFETVVALIFGVFAMWAWVQFNNLELD